MQVGVMQVGVNFWQAMWLGAHDPDRLRRELDLLAGAGLRTLRIMACGEGPDGAPARVAPALSPRPGVYDEAVLAGLGTALDEIAGRGMGAIVCLTNFWTWSGGLAQYRAWAGAGAIPDGVEVEPFTAGFYRDAAARALFDAHVGTIVERHRGHPAVTVWEICNEPRGKHDPDGMRAFLVETAERIRAIDAGARVASGSEGSTATPAIAGLDFAADHAHPALDVTTCHLWPQNWGVWDPAEDDDARFDAMVEWSRAYLRRHAEEATALGKPLWLEELGLARDGGSYAADATTARRDRFFDAMCDEAAGLEAEGASVAGLLVWVWSGEGGARAGDPPHEPPGWYGIASRDVSTLAVLSRHARVGAASDRG